ncbi:MAG: helix-turn-helix transcriptional regulator [Cyanobacteria bacterium P01_D01_bin.6]
MITRLQINHWSEWLIPGSPEDSRLFHGESSDRVWICPPHLGQGYIQEIPLREDLSLNIYDYQLHQNLLIDEPGQANRLEFEFYLEGDQLANHSSIVPCLGFKDLTVKQTRRVFKLEIVFQCPSLMTYCRAFRERLSPRNQIIFERFIDCLWQLLRRPGLTPEGTFRQLLQGKIRPPADVSVVSVEQFLPEKIWSEFGHLNHIKHSPMVPVMEPVIGQILSCPYRGVNRRAYLTRHVLILVALHLEAMVQPSLSDADLDSVFQAAAILRHHLATPPTVESLARQVCTNRFKLNRGFHDIYGTTPYGYLRSYRLHKAQQLLQTTELSISEVAARVGYTNNSQFTLAFRQLMGINPKKFQMHAWQQAV